MTLRRILFTEPWTRIIGIPLLGLVMMYVHRTPPFTFYSFLISTFFTFIIWQGDYMIIMGLRKKWPSLKDTNKRILLSSIVVAPYNVLADFTICETFTRLGVKDIQPWDEKYMGNVAIMLLATFVVGTLYETGYFYSQWRKQSLVTEEIKSQKLRSELNVLKSQVSPHFLFNSLNTLIALIHENQNAAANFTEKLSEVYRYILQVKDKEVVDLGTELEFTRSFAYLLQMRFEKGFEINIEIDDKYMGMHIVPLTLQMLVENAVKHNVVSANQPLSIDIYVENGKSIIVRNKLNRRRNVEKSMKTGLENIRRRYELLSEQEVDVIETREHFMVAMPLLLVENRQEVFIEEA